jgi:hypothetical protein
MRQKRAAGVLGLLFLGCGVGYGQTQPVAREPYLLLATTGTGTMQEELDEAAAQGYHVRLVAPTSGHEVVVLMQHTSSDPRSYKVLATTRTGTLENELRATARAGYRLVRGSAVAKGHAGSALLPSGREEEIFVLMERDEARRERFEYRLAATTRTGTLAREVSEAQAEGFELVDLVSRDEHIAIMERRVETNIVSP